MSRDTNLPPLPKGWRWEDQNRAVHDCGAHAAVLGSVLNTAGPEGSYVEDPDFDPWVSTPVMVVAAVLAAEGFTVVPPGGDHENRNDADQQGQKVGTETLIEMAVRITEEVKANLPLAGRVIEGPWVTELVHQDRHLGELEAHGLGLGFSLGVLRIGNGSTWTIRGPGGVVIDAGPGDRQACVERAVELGARVAVRGGS